MKAQFNASEVAEMLGVHERTVSRHIQAGKLPAARPGKSYIITQQDLAAYMGEERARVVVEAYLKRKGASNGNGGVE